MRPSVQMSQQTAPFISPMSLSKVGLLVTKFNSSSWKQPELFHKRRRKFQASRGFVVVVEIGA